MHGRVLEGRAWFDTVLRKDGTCNGEVARPVRARALSDKALLDAWGIASDNLEHAEEALAIAREIDDPTLLARSLAACGSIAAPTSRDAITAQ